MVGACVGGTKPERQFGVHDYLLAIRDSGALDREKIQQTVVRAALGVPPDQELDLTPGGLKANYVGVLEKLGYRFSGIHFGHRRVYPQQELLTFHTRYKSVFAGRVGGERNAGKAVNVLKMARETIEAAGFGAALYSVVATDDTETAFSRVFPHFRADQYLRWYYLVSVKVPEPMAALCFLGGSRFPVLLLLCRGAELEPAEMDRLRMRVIHELCHYYLMFTLLLDQRDEPHRPILELAGESVAVMTLELVGEYFAHADAARFCGPAYFGALPTFNVEENPQAAAGIPVSVSELPESAREWVRSKSSQYWSLVSFFNCFPWAVALAETAGNEERYAEYVSTFPPLFSELTRALYPFFSVIYRKGFLDWRALLEIVKGFEEIRAYIECWYLVTTLSMGYPERQSSLYRSVMQVDGARGLVGQGVEFIEKVTVKALQENGSS